MSRACFFSCLVVASNSVRGKRRKEKIGPQNRQFWPAFWFLPIVCFCKLGLNFRVLHVFCFWGLWGIWDLRKRRRTPQNACDEESSTPIQPASIANNLAWVFTKQFLERKEGTLGLTVSIIDLLLLLRMLLWWRWWCCCLVICLGPVDLLHLLFLDTKSWIFYCRWWNGCRQAKDVIKQLKKRITNKNATIQILALTVSDDWAFQCKTVAFLGWKWGLYAELETVTLIVCCLWGIVSCSFQFACI